MRPIYVRHSCIATARIVTEVLSRFGVAARPQPVRVGLVGAGDAARHFRAIAAMSDEDLEASYQPATAPGTAGDWSGHLVTVAAETVLIDPSVDQLSRPDLPVHPIYTVIPPGFGQLYRVAKCHDRAGNLLVYNATDNDGYLTSPDWSDAELHRPVIEICTLALRSAGFAEQPAAVRCC